MLTPKVVLVLGLGLSLTAVADQVAIRIEGVQTEPISVSLAQLAVASTVILSIRPPHGDKESAASYRCTPLSVVLQNSGIPMGSSITGSRFAEVIQVRARDGYKAAFALAELEPAISPNGVFLCIEKDSKPLEASEGPLRIIAPAEMRQGRWVRQVESLVWIKP